MESLLLLACPLGMGLMMWFMMRGQKPAPVPEELKPHSLETLRAERARLEAELQRSDASAVLVAQRAS